MAVNVVPRGPTAVTITSEDGDLYTLQEVCRLAQRRIEVHKGDTVPTDGDIVGSDRDREHIVEFIDKILELR